MIPISLSAVEYSCEANNPFVQAKEILPTGYWYMRNNGLYYQKDTSGKLLLLFTNDPNETTEETKCEKDEEFDLEPEEFDLEPETDSVEADESIHLNEAPKEFCRTTKVYRDGNAKCFSEESQDAMMTTTGVICINETKGITSVNNKIVSKALEFTSTLTQL